MVVHHEVLSFRISDFAGLEMSFPGKSHVCHSFKRLSFQETETVLVLSMILKIPACAITTPVLQISQNLVKC